MNINQMWRFPQNIHTPAFAPPFPAFAPLICPRQVLVWSILGLILPLSAFLRQSPCSLHSPRPPLHLPSPPPPPCTGAFRLSHFPTFFFPPLGPCFSAAKFPRLPSVGWSAFTFPPLPPLSFPFHLPSLRLLAACVCLRFPLSSFSAFPFSTYTPSAHSFRYASAHSLRVSFGSAFAFCPLPLFFFRFASFPFIISFASLFSFT